MIFKQLFEPVSSTYTYLLGCEESGEAILIDPVLPTWQRDLAEISALGLKLVYSLDTHIHADHMTAANRLKREVGSRIAGPALDQLPCTDMPIEEGRSLSVGSITLQPLHTPGHTDNHFAYLLDERVFTGDALLIDGCGRTDFQNGDAATLYHTIKDKLFVLSEDVLVYPAHDYSGHRVSSIGQEIARNPRIGAGKTLEEFVSIMDQLDLAYPKFIDFAVPGNRQCGVCPEDLPDDMQQYCEQISHSPQG